MRRNSSWAIVGLSLLCSSCEVGPKAKVVTPPAPPPAVKPAPIVVAQTAAELPDPQPIPTASIPPRPPVEYQPPVKEVAPEPEPPQDQKAAKPVVHNNLRPVRRPAEPAETAAAPPVEEPAVAVPPKLTAADESSVSREQVTGTLTEVQRILKDLSTRPQSASSKATISRIRSFVRLAEQSAARNDFRQGDILARRALALARDLASPK